MRKLLIAGIVSVALVFAVSASAALVPGVFDPGNTGCVEATFIKKTKTLTRKNCPTATNAAAGAISPRSVDDVPVGVVHPREHEPVSGVLATLQRRDIGRIFPRLQQRHADDERQRNRDLSVPLLRRSRQPASRSRLTDGGYRIGERADRRPGDCRSHEYHVQRKAAEARGGFGIGRFRTSMQEGRLEDFTNPTFKNQGQCVKFLIHGRNDAKKNA